MKLKMGLLATTILTVGLLTGCATAGPQPAPSAFDRTVFDVQTNVVNTTNVTEVTNVTTKVVTVTNTVGEVTTTTNVIPVIKEIPLVVSQTNYVYTPKESITSTAGTLGAFGGPWGTLAATALSGALGLLAAFKSRRANVMEDVAGNATQALATAKSVIAALPNSAAVSASFNAWLAGHQNDVDIAKQLAQVADGFLDPTHHDTVAAGIIAQATQPLAPKTA